MTEAEWLANNDPKPMLVFLEERASDRKLRLFAVACCLKVWYLLKAPESKAAVEAAERYAEARLTEAELAVACGAARSVRFSLEDTGYDDDDAFCAACAAAEASSGPYDQDVDYLYRAVATASYVEDAGGFHHFGAGAADLLRDIFGNPFKPVKADPAWLTPTAVGLAKAIYDERAFDRLPILADALEEAGCDSEGILTHCRQPGEHVRGCFVVDLVLGKE